MLGTRHQEILDRDFCILQNLKEHFTLTEWDQRVFIAMEDQKWRVISINISHRICKSAFISVFLDWSADKV